MIARLLACLALAAPVAIAAENAPRLLDDFDLAWRTLDSRYAYMGQGHAAWKRARDSWRPRAALAQA